MLIPSVVSDMVFVQSNRRPSGEDSDGDYCQDTGSEEMSDLEHDSCPSSTDAFSVQDTTCETSTSEASSDESESTRISHEQLIFEFLESEPPYQREPLADKACQQLLQELLSILPDENDCVFVTPESKNSCRFVVLPGDFRS